MNPRQARRERRAAERKARKAALRREKSQLAATPLTASDSLYEDTLGFVSQTTTVAASIKAAAVAPHPGFVSQEKLPVALKRLAINRANAGHSTGPRTPAGKAASSRNATKHGLASGVLILSGEDRAEFDTFLANLLEEFAPATPTEDLLVRDMAQSHWLSLRARRLQERCFTPDGINGAQLALFLRYETTHSRAFYKAFEALRRLQKDRARAERGFVSQTKASPTGFVSQNKPELATKRNPTRKRDAARNGEQQKAAHCMVSCFDEPSRNRGERMPGRLAGLPH